MNLTEQFDKAYVLVSELLSQREGLIEAKLKAEQELADNDSALRKAISQRDEMSAALSIVPAKPKREKKDAEELRQKRRAVFSQLQTIPNTWIQPYGLAILSGVDDADVCEILRRAAAKESIPVEHNGMRGRASKYRWVGDKAGS